jgi:hypothetical protein
LFVFCYADDTCLEYVEFVVSKMSFNAASSRTSMLVDGWPCRNGLERLIHVIAHEMAHVIQLNVVAAYGQLTTTTDAQLEAFYNEYEVFAYPHGFHDGLFGSLVFNFFGHPMGVYKAAVQSSTKEIRNKNGVVKVNRDNKCKYIRCYHRR